MNKEAKVLFLAFIYFSNLMEENQDLTLSDEMRQLFFKLAYTTRMYKHKLDDILIEANEILKDYPSKNIDLLLASVTIIAEYYDQTKGKKRLFSPMSYKQILDLQCSIMDDDFERDKNTIEYCAFLVNKLLNN